MGKHFLQATGFKRVALIRILHDTQGQLSFLHLTDNNAKQTLCKELRGELFELGGGFESKARYS